MSLKTIKVNPIFLSGQGSSFAVKNKTRKEKPTGVSLSQSNSIKKKLIARIKNFQQNGKDQHSKDQHGMQGEETTNDAFSDSLQFLDNLARDKDEKKREKKNTTLKRKDTPNAYMHIATELPPELDWNTIMPKVQAFMQPIQAQHTIQAEHTIPNEPIAQQPIVQPWKAAPQPSYGNLKTGGTKPTYRTWLRTTQKQKPVVKPTLNILEDVDTPFIEEEKKDRTIDTEAKEEPAPNALEPASHAPAALEPALLAPEPAALEPAPAALEPAAPAPAAPAYKPSLKPRRKRVTRTLKYKLGKHANGTVSVLIKNSQTRRKVQTEQALLKQKSILEIKNHLRSNNLLKAGSNAPSDVLRHLYEQSILAGQIENKAKETLIHNYFNDK
jgi:hypothetical protein